MLPRTGWITDVRKCRGNLARWGIINDARCGCGAPIQTVKHSFDESRPLRKYVNGLEDIIQQVTPTIRDLVTLTLKFSSISNIFVPRITYSVKPYEKI